MRYVVAGYSPRVKTEGALQLMRENHVVGLNQIIIDPDLAPLVDHYITYHTLDFVDQKHPGAIEALRNNPVPKYFRNAKGMVEQAEGMENVTWYRIDKPMREYSKADITLGFLNNGATVACSLAHHLGASEIILVGVDFLDNNRADGVAFNCGGRGIPAIVRDMNLFFESFPIPIYKTVQSGPLNLPWIDYDPDIYRVRPKRNGSLPRSEP